MVVRLASRVGFAILLVIVGAGASGCIGTAGTDSGDDTGLTPAQRTAEQKWTKGVYPIVTTACTGCHDGSVTTTPGPAFIAGASVLDVRTTLLGFAPEVVNLDAPGSSRLLTKGAHNGPELTVDQASTILDWITAEKTAAGNDGTSVSTGPYTIKACTAGSAGDPTCPINAIDLANVGLPGAKITFVAQSIAGLYLTQLALDTSVAATGAYLEHPLFVSLPTSAPQVPDILDRYTALTFDLGSNAPTPALFSGGGTSDFGAFDIGDPISIVFKVATPFDSTQVPTTPDDGCKELAQFESTVKPVLVTAYTGLLNGQASSQSCVGCHTAGSAKNTYDLTGITNADDASVLAACNQSLGQITKNTPLMSGFFLDPNPNNGAVHPFKLDNNSYTNVFQPPVLAWVQAEVTAP